MSVHIKKAGAWTALPDTSTIYAKVAGAWVPLGKIPPTYNEASGGTESLIPNYNGTGKWYKVHQFTASGTLTVTKAGNQPFRVLAVGAGGAGGSNGGNSGPAGGSGGGGYVVEKDVTLPLGANAVTVAVGSAGNPAGSSSVGSAVVAQNGANGGTSTGAAAGPANLTTSTITGASVAYSGAGTPGGWCSPNCSGGGGNKPNNPGAGEAGEAGGQGNCCYGPIRYGNDGIVVVAYEVEAPQFNDATGGTITEVQNYNGTGQTWRLHTFTANGDFSVNFAPQPFRLLVVAPGGTGGTACPNGSGGAGGGGGAYLNLNQTIAVGTTAVTVGPAHHNASDYHPNPGTAGNSSFGSIVCGGGGGGGTGAWDGKKPEGGGSGGAAGSGGGVAGGAGSSGTRDRNPAGAAQGGEPAHATRGGLVSDITGTSVTYSVGGGGNDGWNPGATEPTPGSGGGSNDPAGGPEANGSRAGIVVVAYRVA